MTGTHTRSNKMADSSCSSRIFAPYRALGYCCNDVPLRVYARGDSFLVATAVGKSHHVYNCDKLRLIYASGQESSNVLCLAIDRKRVFTASGSVIRAWKKGRMVAEYSGHQHDISLLLTFGEHLISVDRGSNLRIWHTRAADLYGELHFDPDRFCITSVVHPTTYLNKIVLGSRQGALQLWNIRTSKMIYTFPGWGSPVLALEQSPAVDVVGVGLENGTCLLHNLKFDETLMKFHQEWGPVSGLSFRTDGVATMATASLTGEVAVWDLDRRRLSTVIRAAHDSAVTGMAFLPSQPLLLTSGPDNALKMWIFDQSDGSARLLKSRCGHGAPPTKVRFCTKGGQGILSAGLDCSLRLFTTVKDSSAKELSQGSVLRESHIKKVRVEDLKLPPVVDFAVENSRADDWDSVVTCHSGRGGSDARTWHLHHHCIGKHSLKSKFASDGAKPVCATITSCGNFAVLGMNTGHVEVFNMQSGLHRGVLGAHKKAVRGVAVDTANVEVFTGAADSTVKVWSFRGRSCLATVLLDSAVAVMAFHRDSSMLAVACDDLVIRVVDTDTRRIVRIFSGHTNRITDLALSADSHWLISSSVDCTIRTWDLPSGRLLDCFLVDSPASSIALSPVGEYIATTHVDEQGIYLWTNRTLYGPVSLKPLPHNYKPRPLPLPLSGALENDKDVLETEATKEESEEEGDTEEELEYGSESSSEPLMEGLVTLSTLPKSHWASLPNLELIKQRNKPKEPPKAPRAAPFFLPTKPGLDLSFVPAQEDIPLSEMTASSRVLHLGGSAPLSDFQQCLKQCQEKREYQPLMTMLKSLSPSSVDAELRGLAPEAGGTVELLAAMLQFLTFQLRTRRDYELTQAYINVFLKIHGPAIMASETLLSLTGPLMEEQKASWTKLQADFDKSACLLSYFKSAAI